MGYIIKRIISPLDTYRQIQANGGLLIFVKGLLKRPYYWFLQRLFHFDKWHTMPIEHRPYALELCRYVNELIEKEGLENAVEIGCGLGEILARIKVRQRIGFDVDENVIRAGRAINKTIEFHTGTFGDVRGRDIDVLIAVNFIHNIACDELQRQFTGLLANNKVKFIVVDSVGYTYLHNFATIFGDKCEKVWQSREFKHKRTVQVYRNVRL
jgi:SAM-dependent methyltransferase